MPGHTLIKPEPVDRSSPAVPRFFYERLDSTMLLTSHALSIQTVRLATYFNTFKITIKIVEAITLNNLLRFRLSANLMATTLVVNGPWLSKWRFWASSKSPPLLHFESIHRGKSRDYATTATNSSQADKWTGRGALATKFTVMLELGVAPELCAPFP